MKPIVKEVLKNVRFEGDEWRLWVLRQFLNHADIFLSDFNGNIEQASTYPIFIDRNHPEYDCSVDLLPDSVYDSTEYKRVHEVIVGCTTDETFRQGLFLLYILYTLYSDVTGKNLAFYLENIQEFVDTERLRGDCARNHDKWEKICIRFDKSKAVANALVEEPVKEDDSGLGEKWLRANTINPLNKMVIKWYNAKTTYEFDSHKLNYVLHEMMNRENPYRGTFEILLNTDADITLESGELFEEMNRIALCSLDVDEHSMPGRYLGSAGTKGQSIYKKIGRALFPLYAYIQSNREKLCAATDSMEIARGLLGLTTPNYDKLRHYIGKGIQNSEKVSICWQKLD